MLFPIYLVCLALTLAVAIMAIPSDVRSLILENCKNSKGQYRFRYARKELRSVTALYAQLLFVAAIFAVVVGFGLIVVDGYVKLEIVSMAFQQADLDRVQWKENLTSSPDNVEKEFTKAHVAKGGTKESAEKMMRFLWTTFPALLLACFIVMMVSLRLFSNVFNNAMQSLIAEEVKRNRQRVQRRYLRSTQQV